MTSSDRDRNTALRVASSRARAGDEPGAARWLAVARTFAEPSPRQLRSHQAAILDGRRGLVIAGQLTLADAVRETFAVRVDRTVPAGVNRG